MTLIIYEPTEVSEQFHASNAFFRLRVGPVRSGKSVGSQIEIPRRAAEQAPAKDGYRYSKWVVVRRSYPQLKSTTIATWKKWIPEQHFGKISWDSPITHKLHFNDIRAEVLFMPIEGANDIDKLKSLEITGGYINEAQYFPPVVLTTMLERCNSYPPKDMGAPITFSGIWGDTNPPSTRHWIYKLEKRLPENYAYFHDAPAVLKVDSVPPKTPHAISRDGAFYINNPEADYIHNLPTPLFYLNLVPGLSDEEVKVTCMGQYGFTRAGKPVYPDYNDVIHYRPEKIHYNQNEKLYMGWDFGLTPAVSFWQWQSDKRLACIGEIVSEDYGVEKFAELHVLTYLNTHCPIT